MQNIIHPSVENQKKIQWIMFLYMINTTKITKIPINIPFFSNLVVVVLFIINIIIFCIFKFNDFKCYMTKKIRNYSNLYKDGLFSKNQNDILMLKNIYLVN